MRRKGISLIVLVITIIIMIILASAIIISVMDSDIISESKSAVIKNDIQTIKENVNVLKSERMLDPDNAVSFSSIIPDKYKGKIIIDEYTGEIINISEGEDQAFDKAMEEMDISESTDYVKVTNWSELLSAIEENDEVKIILMEDITLTDNVDPIPYFNGTLEGNYKSINNLMIESIEEYDASTSVNYVYSAALFKGLDSDGVITNLTINNANVKGYAATGIFAGINIGSIVNCKVSGKVEGTSSVTGGITGYNVGVIVNCSGENINIIGSSYTGGIAGYATGNIYNCNASMANVTSTSPIAGGFIGAAEGPAVIKDCNMQGTVKGQSGTGGFAGLAVASAIVENCSVTGTVEGGQSTGGFVGQVYNGGIIRKSYSNVNVIAKVDWGGGFAGSTHTNARINGCYSTGTVKGTNNVGGFVGINTTTSNIIDSYATGDVTATGVRVGGFCGRNNTASIIKNSFSTGKVTSSSTSNIGAFVGLSSTAAADLHLGTSKIDNCYYNTDTSNQANGNGGYNGTMDLKGLTNSGMKLQSSYEKLDFTRIWKMGPNHPVLKY